MSAPDVPTQRTYARPQAEALRAAVAAREPAPAAPERLELLNLSAALEKWYASTIRGYRFDARIDDAGILLRAAALALAASQHGYPRPPLERLGRAGAGIPGARTADPTTSHDAARPIPAPGSTPQATRGNMLGKLLVGFAAFERIGNALREAQGVTGPDEIGQPYDRTLTSEELAHRLNLEHTEYAKRCSDLARLGYIRVARDGDGHERTRQGDSGRQRLVFELTDDGRTMAQQLGAGR